MTGLADLKARILANPEARATLYPGGGYSEGMLRTEPHGLVRPEAHS